MKEKLHYIGQYFDTDKDSKLTRQEFCLFFELFYRFTLYEESAGRANKGQEIEMTQKMMQEILGLEQRFISVENFADLQR